MNVETELVAALMVAFVGIVMSIIDWRIGAVILVAACGWRAPTGRWPSPGSLEGKRTLSAADVETRATTQTGGR